MQCLTPRDSLEEFLSSLKRLVEQDPSFKLKKIKDHQCDRNFRQQLGRRLLSAKTFLKKRERQDLAIFERHHFTIDDQRKLERLGARDASAKRR